MLVFEQLIFKNQLDKGEHKEIKHDTKIKERFTSMVMLLIDMIMHQDKEIKGQVAVMKKFQNQNRKKRTDNQMADLSTVDGAKQNG